QLSQGVIGMNVSSVKLVAAAVLLTCGLGLGVGPGWLATADAQPPAGGIPPAKADAQAEVKRLQAELDRLLQDADKKPFGKGVHPAQTEDSEAKAKRLRVELEHAIADALAAKAERAPPGEFLDFQ